MLREREQANARRAWPERLQHRNVKRNVTCQSGLHNLTGFLTTMASSSPVKKDPVAAE